VVTVEWLGQEANGTAGLGVTITADASIEVVANVPAAAYFTVTGGTGTDLGTSAVNEVIEFEVTIEDALGNRNTFPDEIVDVSVTSSNPAAATATAAIFTDDPDYGEGDVPVVTVTTVGSGSTTFDGVVETTAGNLPFSGTITVLAPAITSVTPDNGDIGDVVTIAGSGFIAAGFETVVTVGGLPLGNVTVVSDNSITAQMPTFGDADVYDVIVSVGGVPSAAATWTQNNAFTGGDDEPANDSEATAPVISFPMDFTATIGPTEAVIAFGHYDLYRVTLDAPGTINVTLDWPDAGNDVDVYIWDATGVGGEPDGGFSTFPTGWACGAAGGTLGKPETTGDCALPAGDYLIWIYDFGPGESLYTVEGTYTQD
jgi:hypothetical protein